MSVDSVGASLPGAAYRSNWPDDSMLEAAWGLIANANEGDWDKARPEWREAAVRWREAYHRTLAVVRPALPAPEPPELTHMATVNYETGRDAGAAPAPPDPKEPSQ